ncbi:hypothetical protein SLEP1_g3095 [Rubroshorea leprosula]|uniref:Uncharacterized protein n=1 Tax=Rubroshorea leprosula TaxID=152421 RepID=A0AAV5HTU9_9ROSI|nr:hypothetical protein SLEP1_g3095 [Rubroshorea leprosula]
MSFEEILSIGGGEEVQHICQGGDENVKVESNRDGWSEWEKGVRIPSTILEADDSRSKHFDELDEIVSEAESNKEKEWYYFITQVSNKKSRNLFSAEMNRLFAIVGNATLPKKKSKTPMMVEEEVVALKKAAELAKQKKKICEEELFIRDNELAEEERVEEDEESKTVDFRPKVTIKWDREESRHTIFPLKLEYEFVVVDKDDAEVMGDLKVGLRFSQSNCSFRASSKWLTLKLRTPISIRMIAFIPQAKCLARFCSSSPFLPLQPPEEKKKGNPAPAFEKLNPDLLCFALSFRRLLLLCGGDLLRFWDFFFHAAGPSPTCSPIFACKFCLARKWG